MPVPVAATRMIEVVPACDHEREQTAGSRGLPALQTDRGRHGRGHLAQPGGAHRRAEPGGGLPPGRTRDQRRLGHRVSRGFGH
ncbi:hypothetical protein ON010_g17768 [Phytophthora cinnamomi]|nr:hypothetical protein ON010_g17768 [Phytophthora cinnamomi]